MPLKQDVFGHMLVTLPYVPVLILLYNFGNIPLL